MNSVSFTFRTVRIDFFGTVHVNHDQLPIRETYSFLYFMTYERKSNAFYELGSRFLGVFNNMHILNLAKAFVCNGLELCELLLEVFAVMQTLGTYTGKWQVFGGAHLLVATCAAAEAFAAPRAHLLEDNLVAQDGTDGLDGFLNVVVAFNRKRAGITIVI